MALVTTSRVLITGATGGIGRAFALRYALDGHPLVITGRQHYALETFAGELRENFGVAVDTFAADLTDRTARRNLFDTVQMRGIRVATLINNAGFGTIGEFIDMDPDRLADEIELNAVTVAHLSRMFLPDMLAHGEGAIINIASTAAFQPIPTMAVYAATKAFVLSFSRALWAEVGPKGVQVVAVCPGPTQTDFFDAAGDESVLTRRRSPEQVVETTLAALAKGKHTAVDGTENRVLAHANRLVPVRLAVALARRIARPKH